MIPPTAATGSGSAANHVDHSTLHTSSNASRGPRGFSVAGSPWPRLHRKFDFTGAPSPLASCLNSSRQSTVFVIVVDCLRPMDKRERYKNRIELLQGTLDMLILRTLQWGGIWRVSLRHV
jgi:hypothetical protein